MTIILTRKGLLMEVVMEDMEVKIGETVGLMSLIVVVIMERVVITSIL